ncbi:MAG: signal peptidase I [Clostridiales bacterium]|nr:signal peptidase I [Clostridiales bacterium]
MSKSKLSVFLAFFVLHIVLFFILYHNRFLIPAIILSGSMEPELKAGDMIILKRIKNMKDIHEGDVITFKADNSSWITHRVTDMRTDKNRIYYVTKGDANIKEDSRLVAQEYVLGKMMCIIPYGGYISKFVKTPIGLFFCIVLPLMLITKELRTILY